MLLFKKKIKLKREKNRALKKRGEIFCYQIFTDRSIEERECNTLRRDERIKINRAAIL
jgi:hypothetical protein